MSNVGSEVDTVDVLGDTGGYRLQGATNFAGNGPSKGTRDDGGRVRLAYPRFPACRSAPIEATPKGPSASC